VPTYDSVHHVEAAIRSMLDQRGADVTVVATDDASADGTWAVLERLAGEDGRLHALRNPTRVGLLRNTNRAYREARSRSDAPFVALGSDHDLWSPDWAQTLAGALERTPDAVLAYPVVERIDAHGAPLVADDWRFQTAGVADPDRRVRQALLRMVCGDMVYGLFRRSALPEDALYREVVAPDQLALTLLAREGSFVQHPEVLWRRRFAGLASVARQRRAFWPGARPPLHAYLPWSLTHLALVSRRWGVAYALRVFLAPALAFQLYNTGVRAWAALRARR
jgi:glycosyltransferase involved in cell wall biosynthesis